MTENLQKKIKISDLGPKDEVESIFLIKHIQVNTAKDGKKYLNVILSDASGDLESRAWHNAEEIAASFEKGSFAAVKGKVNIYQGRKQFIIQAIDSVSKDSVNVADFVYSAKEDPEKMFTELYELVLKLDDVYIKELLKNVLEDKEIARRLKSWQAGKSIHHAYRSGLLEHILSCAKLSLSLSEHYKVNKNYVVAGAILHDLCKIYELSDGQVVDYTEEGKLVGHLVKGVEIVDKFSYRIKGFPYDLKMHLKHILLSHHGEYNYGSPKIPQTSEAMLVHLIDHMDSKMHAFETIKRTDQNTGHWSSFVKHLDRIVYKAELPYYSEYLESTGNTAQKKETNTSAPKKEEGRKKKYVEKEVRQNLGNLLKDFKVDSD